ncbi:MAG: DegT/DnrJ/EryC1/StrS aminotransferase [Acidobacteria bacterium]|nr:DegT/DnrJ/EryC1/StrS aminotransferase [Acidobacteriota bacterium]
MWARKRFDIGWNDLGYAALRCVLDRSNGAPATTSEWFDPGCGEDFACLSVRSGFDLLLGAAGFPQGSEVLVSAMTIPDMARIIQHHGLVPVPMDLDPDLAFPPVGQITERVTPRTRAVLIAHLFGATLPLDEPIALARAHNLLFLEDCAQAFRGRDYAGHPDADVSFFSFGTIKTATALGGALARVRNPKLLAAMRRRHADYDVQSRATYFGRVLKYVLLKAATTPPAFRCLVGALRLLGKDYDRVLNSSVSGFPVDRLFELIRRRPCAPLIRLLSRRFSDFNVARRQRRVERGRRLAQALSGALICPASHVSPHAFWVFPILTDEPDAVRLELARHGFDATQGHSMIAVDPPPGRPDLDPRETRRFLSRLLFLPFYDELPDSELDRMAAVLVDFTAAHKHDTE